MNRFRFRLRSSRLTIPMHWRRLRILTGQGSHLMTAVPRLSRCSHALAITSMLDISQ
jgi:hypothetical protein